MSKKMLVDATHPEETRVAVMDGDRLTDFDFESKIKTSFKSNIYLAKVTRVEPSLQAAFVNFGGNRHGFLPFSEIHPDYFKIPIEDREKLMAEQEDLLKRIAEKAEQREKEREEKGGSSDAQDIEAELDAIIEEALEEEKGKKSKAQAKETPSSEEESDVSDGESSSDEAENDASKKAQKPKRRGRPRKKKPAETTDDTTDAESASDDVQVDEGDSASDEATDEKKRVSKSASKADELSEDAESDDESDDDDADSDDDDGQDDDQNNESKNNNRKRGGRGRYRGRRGRRGGKRYSAPREKEYDSIGGDEVDQDPALMLWKKMRRSYKIQEVVKRGQIMLVQVQKEERGNKGAAVTTYITLPGRYGVLMPNSPRGGGISRKINWKDRKKLKDIVNEVAIPKGMSVILRTAAVGRTKADIKRDLDYLYKLWNNIRELTLNSTAPALVYEEGDLIKRAIRDIYTRDIDEVLVSGDHAYKQAKDFMKLMIASHAKRVKKYEDVVPLFQRYHAEAQIDEIYSPQVSLKSGGYLVINPTEALVSIDVNSGKATTGRHIEETALKTNIESAEEVARQLRLRDLGGLVVIDFIDMEDYRNNREVERRLAQALEKDRARVQVGRISNFGLLELSRQRLRPSLMETHFETCKNCDGAGHVRTRENAALRILRAIEEEGLKGRTAELQAEVPADIGLYLLNAKRDILNDIEARYDFRVFIRLNTDMFRNDMTIERLKTRKKQSPHNWSNDSEAEDVSEGADDNASDENDEAQGNGENDANKQSSQPKKRTRRGGRGRKSKAQKQDQAQDDNPSEDNQEAAKENDEAPASADNDEAEQTPKPKPKRRSRSRKKPAEKTEGDDKAQQDKAEDTPQENASDKSKAASNDDAPVVEKKPAAEYETVNQAPEKKKKGWWNKLLD